MRKKTINWKGLTWLSMKLKNASPQPSPSSTYFLAARRSCRQTRKLTRKMPSAATCDLELITGFFIKFKETLMALCSCSAPTRKGRALTEMWFLNSSRTCSCHFKRYCPNKVLPIDLASCPQSPEQHACVSSAGPRASPANGRSHTASDPSPMCPQRANFQNTPRLLPQFCRARLNQCKLLLLRWRSPLLSRCVVADGASWRPCRLSNALDCQTQPLPAWQHRRSCPCWFKGVPRRQAKV